MAIVVLAISIVADGSEKQNAMATDYKVFSVMECYYNSENQSVVVYVSSPNSSLAFSGVDVNPTRGKFEFKILSTYGGKNAAIFKPCLDGGYLVSFSAKDFHLGKDKVVYKEAPGNEHEIPFRGGMKEALLNHKLLPPDWRPPPVKGIPGVSEEK